MQGSHSPIQSMAPNPKVKLLIDTSTNKVLFAEANKDFIDFLFTILACPIGLVTEILTEKRVLGSIGSLHKSLKDLPLDYIQPNSDKNIYLKPKLPIPIGSQGMPLLGLPETTPDVNGTICYHCNQYMGNVHGSSRSSSSGEGCVKGVVTYMVMDNLEVSPMSAISSMALLNKFHVMDVGALVEKVVEVGTDEGLALLKASLESQTVLTDVFGEKPNPLPL